jgi:4-diphosphocytidyl-2-C-methyl-D-erythritol kinase
VITFPNAKINLGLNVTGKRTDGYHSISSCLYPIGLKDILEIMESDTFLFSSSGLTIPGNQEDNLVIKAFRLLKKDFNLPEVRIHLHKSIPTGAGLGGGSADGAFALKMLNSLFELFLDDSILAEYALTLGSDCPFFIYNQPMLATGRGDELKALNDRLQGYYLFLVMPDMHVSTRQAYQLITPREPQRSVENTINNYPVDQWVEILKNDFEEGIFKQIPAFHDIKNMLYDRGAVYASMTGSGSAFYGIYKERPDLKNRFPDSWFTWTGRL